MKKLILICVFSLPFTVSAQFDFDSRYFTIDESSLPAAPQSTFTIDLSDNSEKFSSSFTLEQSPTFRGALNELRISATNYWEPVDMRDVASTSNRYVGPLNDVAALNVKTYGFTNYAADGSSKVKNTVYTEVRGLNVLDPCPPVGICPRCAPYRLQRGY